MHGVGLRSSNCLYSVCRELRCAAMLAVAMLVWLYIRSSCHLSTVAVERSFCIVIFAVAVYNMQAGSLYGADVMLAIRCNVEVCFSWQPVAL